MGHSLASIWFQKERENKSEIIRCWYSLIYQNNKYQKSSRKLDG